MITTVETKATEEGQNKIHLSLFSWIRNLITTIVLLAIFSPFPCLSHEPMLPQVATQSQPFTGWWLSEKLDGVRGYWDGEKLWSKNGHLLHPPAQFTQGLPPFALEGELWAGRNSFETTSATVLRQAPHLGWLKLQFAIFDVPVYGKSFRQRIDNAKRWFKSHPSEYAFVIEQTEVRSEQHLQQELSRINHLGGEGLIVRDPEAHYRSGRSHSICKVKPYHDDEAVVIAHQKGQGQNLGYLGALVVQNSAGITFKIGTGFSQSERQNPPAIGTTITYKYNGLYRSKIPKFPVFLRIRKDSEL